MGWDPATRQLLMHDPNGEVDFVNGGDVSTAIGSGKAQRYSERNWGRRSQVKAQVAVGGSSVQQSENHRR